jgi:hypothetical protein
MVIEDSLIRDMSPAQLHCVMAPKIAGTLNLHALTRDRDMDFLLLYSSATTLFGNSGQAAYVAANMALEALGEVPHARWAFRRAGVAPPASMQADRDLRRRTLVT